jgi:hypothetical protein
MITIKLDSYKAVSVFLREEKLYMHSLIVESVKEGWKNKLDVVPVLEFHVNENIIKIDIIEAEYKRSLELALSYYEENEYYEKCMEINSLIHDIQEN